MKTITDCTPQVARGLGTTVLSFGILYFRLTRLTTNYFRFYIVINVVRFSLDLNRAHILWTATNGLHRLFTSKVYIISKNLLSLASCSPI